MICNRGHRYPLPQPRPLNWIDELLSYGVLLTKNDRLPYRFPRHAVFLEPAPGKTPVRKANDSLTVRPSTRTRHVMGNPIGLARWLEVGGPCTRISRGEVKRGTDRGGSRNSLKGGGGSGPEFFEGGV